MLMPSPATHLHLNRRWPCDVLSGQLPHDGRRKFHIFEVKDGRQQMPALHNDVEAVAQLLSLFGCLPPHFQWRLPPCAKAARVLNALRMAPCSTKSSLHYAKPQEAVQGTLMSMTKHEKHAMNPPADRHGACNVAGRRVSSAATRAFCYKCLTGRLLSQIQLRVGHIKVTCQPTCAFSIADLRACFLCRSAIICCSSRSCFSCSVSAGCVFRAFAAAASRLCLGCCEALPVAAAASPSTGG